VWVPYRAAPLIDAFIWITTLGTEPAVTTAAVIGSCFLWATPRGRKLRSEVKPVGRLMQRARRAKGVADPTGVIETVTFRTDARRH
jgi:hypothetical protein